MSKKRQYKLIIVKEKPEDDFTKSVCECNVCQDMNRCNEEEWDSFKPETTLQKNMKAVIEKIEKREREKRLKKKVKK